MKGFVLIGTDFFSNANQPVQVLWSKYRFTAAIEARGGVGVETRVKSSVIRVQGSIVQGSFAAQTLGGHLGRELAAVSHCTALGQTFFAVWAEVLLLFMHF